MKVTLQAETGREQEESDEVTTQRYNPRVEAAEAPRLSRRERRKIATREALLKAAEEVIASKGVYLAVIEEITERADVAKGLFYQYFHDRDDLLHALLVRRLSELRTAIDEAPPHGAIADRIARLIGQHLDYFLQHEDFLLFLHQIRGLIKMKQDGVSEVREAYRRHILFVAETLVPDLLQVPEKKQLAEEIACALLGVLTGFLSHAAIMGSLKDLHADRERVAHALTQACLGFCDAQRITEATRS